jgi:hypothetical protein
VPPVQHENYLLREAVLKIQNLHWCIAGLL